MSSKKRYSLTKKEQELIFQGIHKEYALLFAVEDTKLFKVVIMKDLIARNKKHHATNIRFFHNIELQTKRYDLDEKNMVR